MDAAPTPRGNRMMQQRVRQNINVGADLLYVKGGRGGAMTSAPSLAGLKVQLFLITNSHSTTKKPFYPTTLSTVYVSIHQGYQSRKDYRGGRG